MLARKEESFKFLINNELKYIQELEHRNIVRTMERIDEKNKIFLVQEDLQGGTLLDRMNQCIKGGFRFSMEEICTIIY